MNDHQRQQRRHKKLEKHKKRRANLSRPARTQVDASRDPAAGRSWPVGECWASQHWDTPGATLHVLISRVDPTGVQAVVAILTIDRAGRGVLAAEALGGLPAGQVQSQVAKISEATGQPMMEVAPGIAAGLVRDAAEHGSEDFPEGWESCEALLAGIEVADLGVPFGPEPIEAEPKPGLLARVRGWFGA